MTLTCAYCHERFEAPDNGYQDRRKYCSNRCWRDSCNEATKARRRNRFSPAMPDLPGIRRAT
ncbi:hypothetical protein D4S03_10135 [bacterium]|nr:MAG: hypothetical protein D4S03_10135 [bacterium]